MSNIFYIDSQSHTSLVDSKQPSYTPNSIGVFFKTLNFQTKYVIQSTFYNESKVILYVSTLFEDLAVIGTPARNSRHENVDAK